MSGTTYALDNHHTVAVEHHHALAALFDRFTRSRVNGLGAWRPDARCLEIGAGGGSLSQWLASEVSTAGLVVALDLKPQLIAPHPRLVTLAYDLTGTDPLPEPVAAGGFDLIVGRFVLGHLANREQLLPRLAELLAPGGWLLIEDFGEVPDERVVIEAPTPADAQLYRTYQRTVWQVFDASGTDRTWPYRTWPAMAAAGLGELDTVVHARLWAGGSAGTQLAATTCAQLEPKLLQEGMSDQQLERVKALRDDPRLVIHGLPVYSTSGKRPPNPLDGVDPSACPGAARERHNPDLPLPADG